MSIQEIKDLIGEGKLERALKATTQLPQVKADDDLQNMITLFMGQFNRNEKAHLMHTKSFDQYNVEKNRLQYNLLSTLSDLDESEVPPPSPIATSGTQPPAPIEDDITKILFLAANPSNTAKLQLTKEHSAVSRRLQDALEPHKFPIAFENAVTPSQFSQSLFLDKPDIVHFSGHGDKQTPEVQTIINSRAGRQQAGLNTNATNDESGIFLLSEDFRDAHFVNTTFLKRTFKSAVKRQGIPIKVVIFNACHSSEQAQAISEVVPYVIGTSWSVGDDAAIAFASGFYFGIAQNMSIENAVDFGINQALAFNEPEDRFLLYKHGVKVEW